MPASRDDVIHPSTAPHERSVAGLFGQLARETSRLIRQEIALARAEVLDRLGQLGTGAAELAIGGVLAFAGFLVLLASAVLGLSNVLPAWLAALIVGVVVLAIGGFFVLKGRRDVEPANLVPRRTLRTLRDDAEWAKEQMR
jgi:hypothetical protein